MVDQPAIGATAATAASTPEASTGLRRFVTDATDEEIVGYTRSPSDVVRLIAYGSTAIIILLLTRFATDTIVGIQRDIVSVVDVHPTVERLLIGAVQIVVAVVALLVFVPAFVLRRYRLLGYIVLGNVLSDILLSAAVGFLDKSNLETVAHDAAHNVTQADVALRPHGLGNIACSFIILAPFVSARWRRAGIVLMVLFSVVRLMVSRTLPDDLFLALAIGATAGCLILLAFGRPGRRPTLAAVRAGLESSGLAVTDVAVAPPGPHDTPEYRATLTDGERIAIRVVNPADRSADILYRTYRLVRLKEVGDERPFSSLRRGVEHEALVALQARDVGVQTPRLRAVAEVGSESMMLAYDHVEGRLLVDVPASEVDDDLLRRIWEQVATLRTHRIGHRDLQRANIIVDRSDEPWLVDFDFSEIAAPDTVLDADVAQLMAALAIVVGATRSVDSALEVLGPDVVGEALPLLQSGALRAATRSAMREHKGLLDELRATVADRCHIEQPHYAQLERLNRRTVLTIGSLALATYFLLPQFTDVQAILQEIGDANWWWFPLVLLMSGVTYAGASLAINGSVPQPIPHVPTFITQIGSSFTSILAPAGIGGMALNTRFLQKSGVDGAVAVSAVGLNTVVGFAMHLLLLTLFVVWAGSSTFHSVSLPDPAVVLYGVGAVAVLAAIAFAVPATRTQITSRLVPVLRRSLDGLGRTLRRPLKLLLLFGGSVLVSLGYILALYFSIEAFDGDLNFAKVGAVFLVGAAIATVAPTPGGIGALEAALIAGLVAAGMDNTVAVPAVFLYRFATFWIPIVPGYFAFHWLQRADYV